MDPNFLFEGMVKYYAVGAVLLAFNLPVYANYVMSTRKNARITLWGSFTIKLVLALVFLFAGVAIFTSSTGRHALIITSALLFVVEVYTDKKFHDIYQFRDSTVRKILVMLDNALGTVLLIAGLIIWSTTF